MSFSNIAFIVFDVTSSLVILDHTPVDVPTWSNDAFRPQTGGSIMVKGQQNSIVKTFEFRDFEKCFVNGTQENQN
jgi:hypothetical protein